MPFEMMLWKVAGTKLYPIEVTQLDLEQRLEDLQITGACTSCTWLHQK
jgi:hypothetical protein